MERHDAAIVGAGPEGLIAAVVLARAKRRVIVVERRPRPGGRAETYEFHPGFRASPYADELPAMPVRLFRTLDFPQRGAFLMRPPASACVSDAGISVVFADHARAATALDSPSRAAFFKLRDDTKLARQAIDARALVPAKDATRRRFLFWKTFARAQPWPVDEWQVPSLEEVVRGRISDPALRVHVIADAVSGRALSPFLAGTALHLLAPGTGRSGVASGGLGAIGAALMSVAATAGASMRCGAEVHAIRLKGGSATGLLLGGGEEIEARAVLSTLDVKRTFAGLGAQEELPPQALRRFSRYRVAGQMARVLIALDGRPEFGPPFRDAGICLGPIHVVASAEAISRSYDFWRQGVLPQTPLVTLRVPSLADPRLAPAGKAVMTATISCVPGELAEGAWTPAWRTFLAELALAAAERVAPGISQRVLAGRTIVAPDIETALGLTAGDLDGGELAPDQALGSRPFGDENAQWTAQWLDGRTPVPGLYLGGPSSATSPFLLGVAGERAAATMLADLAAGKV